MLLWLVVVVADIVGVIAVDVVVVVAVVVDIVAAGTHAC